MKLSDVPQEDKLAVDYDEELLRLQHELLNIQRTYFRQGRRAIILFEGWDAAGKGGIIRRLTEKLDPRGFDVNSISKPDPEDQSKHYLYRFWQRIPAAGRFEIFDRSWYGRVLVERIENFCSKAEWQRAYEELNQFEKVLSDDGVRLIKVFLHISKEEQLKRFKKRYENPLKRWKLTADDFRNREKWDLYTDAIEDMLEKCNAPTPWLVVGANTKKIARIKSITHITDVLTKGVDISPPPVQPGVEEYAKKLF